MGTGRLILIIVVACFEFGGRSNGRESRIVGGRLAYKGEFPYAVKIFSEAMRSICGGVIINRNNVLTACHCLVEDILDFPLEILDHRTFNVVAGLTFDMDIKDIQRRKVLSWQYHPHCIHTDRGIQNDSGAIELSKPFSFNEYVHAITLPINKTVWRDLIDKLYSTGVGDCVALGWGVTVVNPTASEDQWSHPSKFLKALDMNLTDQRDCVIYLCRRYRTLTKKLLCMKETDELFRNGKQDKICADTTYAPNNGSVCKGDSGGPLVCDGELIGTTSYGDRFCADGSKTVFTRLEAVYDFISQYFSSDSMKRFRSFAIMYWVLGFHFMDSI